MIRHTAHAAWFLAGLSLLLLAGCGGPTRTAGTGGLAAGELAVLSVPQLPKEAHLKIRSIQFDSAGDEHNVGGGRDFYLLPRDHTATFTLEAVVPKEVGFLGSLLPKDALIIPGPRNLPLGVMSAGKAYELMPPVQGFDKLMQTGELSLVREKQKIK